MKYSVIIPCYNSEKTISEAIHSIPNISSDIEIIVIDDGSTDNTCNIVNSLCDEYKSIVLIKQENQGAGAARQKGVETSKGEYITFLDSDDIFDTAAFSVFDSIISQHPDADIIRFKNNNFTDISEVVASNNFSFDDNLISVFNHEAFVNEVFCNEIIDGTVAVTLWGKIYKRDLFSEAVKDYGENILEDYYINMQYYMHVNKCIDIDAPLYWWRDSNDGASHSYHTGTPEMIETVHSYKLSCMKELGVDTDNHIRRANDWLMRFCSAVIYFTKDMTCKERKSEYKKINNILKKYAVYGNLGSSAKLRDTKVLKTRCFFVINMYYNLRWRK